MQLIKLRSMDGEGFFYAIDMMVNERIYLSTCEYMNDIDEGIWRFTSGLDKAHRSVGKEFRELIDAQRFTCFLDNIDNPLIWAHYAGGFSGVAFIYEIDELKYDVREIDYIGVPKVTKSQVEQVLSRKILPQDIGLLKQKESYWAYEKERRLYVSDGSQYVNKMKPMAIVFGARNTKYIEPLRKIARILDIRVGYMSPKSSSKFVVEYDD
jgi:hypothetical protein